MAPLARLEGRLGCTYEVHTLTHVRASLRMGSREGARQRPQARCDVRRGKAAFADERALVIDDPDNSDEEPRFVLLGLSSNLRTLVVVHCYRAEAQVIRIISARKATRAEAECYR